MMILHAMQIDKTDTIHIHIFFLERLISIFSI